MYFKYPLLKFNYQQNTNIFSLDYLRILAAVKSHMQQVT